MLNFSNFQFDAKIYIWFVFNNPKSSFFTIFAKKLIAKYWINIWFIYEISICILFYIFLNYYLLKWALIGLNSLKEFILIMVKKTKNKVLPIKGIVDIQQVFFDGKDFKKEKNNKKSVKKRFQVHTL